MQVTATPIIAMPINDSFGLIQLKAVSRPAPPPPVEECHIPTISGICRQLGNILLGCLDVKLQGTLGQAGPPPP